MNPAPDGLQSNEPICDKGTHLASFELLYEGLLSDCERLQKFCLIAVEGLGGRFGSFLEARCRGEDYTHKQQERLGRAATLLVREDTLIRAGRRRLAMQHAVMEGLCSSVESIHSKAMESLPGCCEDPAHELATAALVNIGDPQRCLKLLRALDASGLAISQETLSVLVDLFSLMPQPYLKPARQQLLRLTDGSDRDVTERSGSVNNICW